MTEKNLTKSDAYLAMFSFLEEYYKRTHSDDVGSLLSGMCLMSDNMPMDQAYWHEWEKAIQKALKKTVDVESRLSRPDAH